MDRPRIDPCSVAVRTTLLTRVTPPVGSPGTRVSHSVRPVRASIATTWPRMVPVFPPKYSVWSGYKVSGALRVATKTVPCADAGGVSTPPKVPGRISVGPLSALRLSFSWIPTGVRQSWRPDRGFIPITTPLFPVPTTTVVAGRPEAAGTGTTMVCTKSRSKRSWAVAWWYQTSRPVLISNATVESV